MRHVATNADLETIHRAGTKGLVFNDYPSVRSAAQDKVLHLAGCSSVARMLEASEHVRRSGCPEDLLRDAQDEAGSWLASHRRSCGDGVEALRYLPAWSQRRSAAPSQPDRGTVQCRPQPRLGSCSPSVRSKAFLYSHLRRYYFSVRERVPVPGGIIDAVAERDGARVVIEVKGEDKGGYGSAQMNFQIAIGQVSSRMNDPAAAYAIAFPLTTDYGLRRGAAHVPRLACIRAARPHHVRGKPGRLGAGGSRARSPRMDRELASREPQ